MRAPPPGVTLLPWQGSPRPGRPCRALQVRPCMHCGTSFATASTLVSRLPLCRPASIRRQRSFRDDGLRRWSYAGHTQLKRQPASTQQGNHRPPPGRHGSVWRVSQSSAPISVSLRWGKPITWRRDAVYCICASKLSDFYVNSNRVKTFDNQ